MDFKNKMFILVLIILIFMSVSVSFANENITELNEIEDVNAENIQNEDGESPEIVNETSQDTYNAKIIADDYTSYYDSDQEILVKVKDLDGNLLDGVEVNIVFSNKQSDSGYTEYGKCSFYTYGNVGKYKATITLKDSYYTAKPLTINVKITKAPIKINVKKIISDTKSYTILKATVTDKYGLAIDEGTVSFKINGKTYNAKVKNGVATKKIKLTKAKTYKCKVSFSSKNYASKTTALKVVIKKAKKYYTFKAGKYKIKLTYKQFKKLLNAKDNGKSSMVELKTGKYYTYKKQVYKKVKVKKTKWVYKKVLSYESFYYDDGTYDSYSYDLTSYYKKGWKLYGWYDKSYSDGYESYAKLKKKVKYTTTKKVKNGYKKAKSPIYFYIETIDHDGQCKKGDYLTVWTDGGADMGIYLAYKKINLYSYL